MKIKVFGIKSPADKQLVAGVSETLVTFFFNVDQKSMNV
jgi:hypothetical protein